MVNNSSMSLLSFLNLNKWFKSDVNTKAASPLSHAAVSANVNPPPLIDQATISSEAKRLAEEFKELNENMLAEYLSQSEAAMQRMEQTALRGYRMEPEEPQ